MAQPPQRPVMRAIVRLLPLLLFRAVTSEESTVSCASVSFAERDITDSADGAVSVFAADGDGDGDVDVVAASAGNDTVAWYNNDGSQSFAERVITTLADGAREVTAIDVDGDLDVDVLSASDYDDTVAWYESSMPRPSRRSSPSTSYPAGFAGVSAPRRRSKTKTMRAASRRSTAESTPKTNGSESFAERAASTLADLVGFLLDRLW